MSTLKKPRKTSPMLAKIYEAAKDPKTLMKTLEKLVLKQPTPIKKFQRVYENDNTYVCKCDWDFVRKTVNIDEEKFQMTMKDGVAYLDEFSFEAVACSMMNNLLDSGRSKHVVRTLDCSIHDNLLFIDMQNCRKSLANSAKTLSRNMRRTSPRVNRKQWLEVLMFQIFHTLHVLQKEHKFVHQDLHPMNILLVEERDTPEFHEYTIGGRRYSVPNIGISVRIIDFALSHFTINGQRYANINEANCYGGLRFNEIMRTNKFPVMLKMDDWGTWSSKFTCGYDLQFMMIRIVNCLRLTTDETKYMNGISSFIGGTSSLTRGLCAMQGDKYVTMDKSFPEDTNIYSGLCKEADTPLRPFVKSNSAPHFYVNGTGRPIIVSTKSPVDVVEKFFGAFKSSLTSS
jgi:serine/threonine protein kinase